jgi:hypothetical protein
MRGGPDRLNRALLVLLALLLLGVGAYGLGRGYEAFGTDQAHEPLLVEPVRDWVGRNGNWFWPVVFVVSIVVAYLSLRWLLAQFGGPRVDVIDFTRDSSKGSTRLRAAGAARALAEDIEAYLEVSSATARVVSDGERPEVDLKVDVHDDADVPALRAKIEDEALLRFCQALEVPDVTAHVLLRLTGPTERIVR